MTCCRKGYIELVSWPRICRIVLHKLIGSIEKATRTLFHLGVDLACLVLREWLSLTDVSRVDRAFCNKQARHGLWELFGSPQCVLSESPSKAKNARAFVDWLLKRGIRSSKLTLGCKMALDTSLATYLNKYGQSVKGMLLRGYNLCGTKPYWLSCPNLVSVVFERPRFCSLKPAFSPNLLILGLRNGSIKLDDLHHIINHSPHIEHLDISGCDFHKRGRSTPTPQHLRLKSLDISLIGLEAKFVFALLRNSGTTLQELYMYSNSVVDEQGSCAYNELLKHCSCLHTVSVSISLDDDEHWLTCVDLNVFRNIKTLIMWDVLETDPYVIEVLQHCNSLEHLQLDLIHSPNRFEFTKLRRILPKLRTLAATCCTHEMHVSWHVFLQAFLNARPEVQFAFVQQLALHSMLAVPLH